jgi:TRAP transporter TAXI family solute receptor
MMRPTDSVSARIAAMRAGLAARHLRRELILGVILAVVLVIAAFVVAFRFVQPAPPRTIVISTGSPESGYHRTAQRYQQILARDGVHLELRTSVGALENVGRMMDPGSGVQVGFVQAGTSFAANAPDLVSLASLYYEPLWVFYRGPAISDLDGLRGRRIAIGPEESGSRTLALQLLAMNAAVLPPTELVPVGGNEGAEQLARGRVDAMMYVGPPDAPVVERLVTSPGVRLLSFDRARGYARRFPFLTPLVLPRGVYDFARNLPAEDVTLLAPTANLVARRELHPALAYLLLRAASQVHGEATLVSARGDFPVLKDADFPFSDEAKRYFRAGTPLLQRYLPFWAANLVDRMWIMLVPVLAVALPLVRLLPPLYAWRVRSRIYRWYAKLKEIEIELDEQQSAEQLGGMLARLDEIELAVNHIPTPLAFSENLYVFRSHIDLVRARVRQRIAAGAE